MPEKETAVEWSLRTWKERHNRGYFPKSEQHRGWKIYDHVPKWLLEHGLPVRLDKVLEIGCGYGEWMIPLSPLVKELHGIDIHPGLASKSAEKFAEHGVQNCHFTLSDGLSVPYPDKTFDLVYSVTVFQHIPREIVHGYLKESDRVMAEGGRSLHHFRNANNVGNFPTPAKDITAYHTGDFSCGWTAQEVYEAGMAVGWKTEVIDDGLFLVLKGTRND